VFKLAIPVLYVKSITVAEEFYCKRLGFTQLFAHRNDDTQADPCYMGLARDAARLHISSYPGDLGTGSGVVITIDDVDALYAELLPKDVNITMPPTSQDWGNREMYVRDPDGNRLAFVCEIPPVG
jgi:uncharacterized glyoxalase superfamily protein PhnB